jgi:hypothetical protein
VGFSPKGDFMLTTKNEGLLQMIHALAMILSYHKGHCAGPRLDEAALRDIQAQFDRFMQLWPGNEIPKGCQECPGRVADILESGRYGGEVCFLTKNRAFIPPATIKPDWCPLGSLLK